MSDPDINAPTIREFVNIVVAQAKAATAGMKHPGFLQLLHVHPARDNDAAPARFRIDDVEGIVSNAIAAAESGQNVYIEARTIRHDANLKGKQRGELRDTGAVFALVVDSDGDTGRAWTPPANAPPSLITQTSPGNRHFWYFVKSAINAAVAKKLGERMRKATGSDHDTGNPVQPYRLAGTPNYPNKTKQARGRTSVQPTSILEFDDRLWTLRELARAFPRETRQCADRGNGEGELAELGEIPPDTMRAIRDGVADGRRSDVFFNVMIVLERLGYTAAGALALLEAHPNGIAQKYVGRLQHEIERVFDKLNQKRAAGGERPGAAPSATPVFDPWERYIVPEFPFHILPPTLQNYVDSQSKAIGCDPSALAMATLAATSGALDHRFAVKMQRGGDWWEHPRIWALLVGDPSTKKTPCINAATRPLDQHDAELGRNYKAKLRACEQAKAAKDNTVEPPDPPVRYVVTDITAEKLGEILSRSDHGILSKRDEISGWIGGMDRYGGGAHKGASDRATWLKAFDGGPYNVDRINRGEIHVGNLSVSLIGGIQPDRLAELHGLTSDGLLQRFAPTMMRAAARPRDIDNGDDRLKYENLIASLIRAPHRRMHFTDDALAAMKELQDRLFDIEQASGGLARGFQGFVGKLQGLAGRLSIILHMAADPEYPCHEIGAVAVCDVSAMIRGFIIPHALELYRSMEGMTDGDGEGLRKIASWLITSKQALITSRDLARNVRHLRGLALPEVQKLLSPLVAAGWLEPVDPGPANRRWAVTPSVAAQFERRRLLEEERKTALAELMGAPRNTP
jgi:hypothetical protein